MLETKVVQNPGVNVIMIPFDMNKYVCMSGSSSVVNVSFFVIDEQSHIGVEWEPMNGAITYLIPTELDVFLEEVNRDDQLKLKIERLIKRNTHWYFGLCRPGIWEQSRVDDEKLPKKFEDGDFKAIFCVLERCLNEYVEHNDL